MGNEVFIRSQKGLTITPEGEKVANYAKEMLQREEDIKSELAVFRTETHGTLKIAVASVIGQYWLPPVLKSLCINILLSRYRCLLDGVVKCKSSFMKETFMLLY